MTDSRLRAAARAASTGDVDAEARLLLERVRAGRLSRERLELAAYCGHEGARLVACLGRIPCPPGPRDSLRPAGDWESVDSGPAEDWARGLAAWEPSAGMSPLLAGVVVAACRFMLDDAKADGAAHGEHYEGCVEALARAETWIDAAEGLAEALGRGLGVLPRPGSAADAAHESWQLAWNEADGVGTGSVAPAPADALNAGVLAQTVAWVSGEVGLRRSGLKAAIRAAALRWALDGEA